jgi:hypothetical protein
MAMSVVNGKRSRPKGPDYRPAEHPVAVSRTIPRPKLPRPGTIPYGQRQNFLLYAYALAYEHADRERKIHNAEWRDLLKERLGVSDAQAKGMRKQLHKLGLIETTRGARYSFVTKDPHDLLDADLTLNPEVQEATNQHPVSKPRSEHSTLATSGKGIDVLALLENVCAQVAALVEDNNRLGRENAELRQRLEAASKALNPQ